MPLWQLACITMRERTVRPVAVDEDNHHQVGSDPAYIVVLDILGKGGKADRQPHL